ncbi:MAG: DUF6461 domain-containing protein [Umezawaea sp.]
MDHDLTFAVAAAIPLVLRHIPPTPAAELGRVAVERPARRPKSRDSAVSGALRGVRVLDRLLGALELPVDALHVPVPPGLVSHLGPREGTFGMLGFDGENGAVQAVRLLEVFHVGATDLVAATVRELVGDDAIAPLLVVVGPEHTDEAEIAGRHGAVHLALCVATAAGLLRALGTDVARAAPAVIGTGVGAAALLLADLPMPESYQAAVLEKRRAEYHYPRWSSNSPLVRDHRFALAEGPVPDVVDFSANGLVAVVPGGVVVRTGAAEGRVPVSLRVFDGPPPDVDLLTWDEVVEVSWTAEHGEAALGGRETTPPWPGEYRVLVQTTGRDEGDEGYCLSVWAAPAAGTVVHKRTDRLGHRLRGEPEPPVVVTPDRAHWWVESSSLEVAATVTVVVGLSAEEVLRAFGADPDAPRSLEDPRYHGGDPWVAVLAVDGAVVAFEENGYLGIKEGVLERLSRNGKAASAFWNVNTHTALAFARGGQVLASFEPGLDSGDDSEFREAFDDPEVREALDGIDFDDHRHHDAKLVTAVARFTGHVVTEAEFDAVQVAHFTQE